MTLPRVWVFFMYSGFLQMLKTCRIGIIENFTDTKCDGEINKEKDVLNLA